MNRADGFPMGSILSLPLERGLMKLLDRITIDPALMNGQPCIRHMRLTVRRVIELLALYLDPAELRREYPELQEEDVRQALLYSATYLDDRTVELVP